LEDEGLDLVLADAEHGGDVVVGVVAELEQHQCGSLVGGQPLNVLHDLT
jgi:hypothetical protein